MDTLFNDYLGVLEKAERKEILTQLNKPYARLEIDLQPPPVTYKVVVP